MIKGGRECAVARSWVEKFESTLAGIDARLERDGPDWMLEAKRRGLQSKTDDLKRDVAEYEALVSGKVPPADANNLEELPEALIKRRIGLGMTRRKLAERMGVREEEVERHELTDYESAGYARLMEAHAALSAGAERGGWRGDAPSEARVLSRIGAAGLGGSFVDECIVVWPCSRGDGAAGAAMYERKLLSRLYKIYGWSPDMLAGDDPLEVEPVRARFRLRAGADRTAANAHARYAEYMAGMLAAGASSGGEARRRPVWDDPHSLRVDLEKGGPITFPRLVECAWNAGIVVGHLPPLAFRTAYFGGAGAAAADDEAAGQGAIMLAGGEGDAAESELLLDLAHEMYHAGRGPGCTGAERGERAAGEEESKACRFAHAVLVGPRADEMFRACMDRCAPDGGGGEAQDAAMLARAASEAALEGGARADSLAEYVAHRLGGGEPARRWRMAARSLRVGMPEWRRIVVSAIASHADLACLSSSDFALLSDVMGPGRR